MGPNMVVIEPPGLDGGTGVEERRESMFVEQLVECIRFSMIGMVKAFQT